MSIPRDLKVEIPGVGTDKFNAAYAYGGAKLTMETVKQLTGLPINHVVNVDFLGFVQAVYAIGQVYADVDRRYYHSNVRAYPPTSSTPKTTSPTTSCSAASGPWSTSATATPTPTSSARPASRTSSAPLASGSRSTTWSRTCSSAAAKKT